MIRRSWDVGSIDRGDAGVMGIVAARGEASDATVVCARPRSNQTRDCSSMACLEMSDARRDGCVRRRPEIPGRGDSKRCWAATDGTLMRCATWCASMSLSISLMTMPCWSSMKPASSNRASHRAALHGSTRGRQGRSRTARSACSLPMCRATAMLSSIERSIYRKVGPMIRRV